ncbi:hypothetical protein ACM43_10425 [Bradyrhizobium sp. CCBAU 45321]|nr:hypothetical protein [Bradyrhizobium sp. CCBAU 45321]
MFICEMIFNTSPLELFPGLMSDLQVAILRRASELYETLQGDPSKATRLKLDFLERLLERVEGKRIDATI